MAAAFCTQSTLSSAWWQGLSRLLEAVDIQLNRLGRDSNPPSECWVAPFVARALF